MGKREPILRVENLNVRYRTLLGTVKAVNNVTFDLYPGEVLGLAGESGCGKTTLGLTLMRLLPNNGYVESGRILIDGIDVLKLKESEVREIRWKKISMIFQGAMNALNPVFKVGDQIAEVLEYHEGIPKKEALERVKEMFIKVGLDPDRINNYPHQFSGGMKQRAVIAMALILKPPVVIADEPTTALDVTIQAQILELLKSLQREYKMSFIYITHDLAVLAQIATKVGIMYAGYLIEYGDVLSIYKKPIHPYTKGLIGSVPSISRVKEAKKKKIRLFSIPGAPPDLRKLKNQCPFADRCPIAKKEEICWQKIPEIQEVDGRKVRCFFAEELKDVSPYEFWEEYGGDNK